MFAKRTQLTLHTIHTQYVRSRHMVFVLRILLSSFSQFQFCFVLSDPSQALAAVSSLQWLQAQQSVQSLAPLQYLGHATARRGLGDQLQFMAVLGNMQVHKIQSTHISAITIQIVWITDICICYKSKLVVWHKSKLMILTAILRIFSYMIDILNFFIICSFAFWCFWLPVCVVLPCNFTANIAHYTIQSTHKKCVKYYNGVINVGLYNLIAKIILVVVTLILYSTKLWNIITLWSLPPR